VSCSERFYSLPLVFRKEDEEDLLMLPVSGLKLIAVLLGKILSPVDIMRFLDPLYLEVLGRE